MPRSGQRVARSRYHREVDRVAVAILEELKNEGTGVLELHEEIEEKIITASREAGTYTKDTLDIVMHSDSWLAIDDAADEGLYEWGRDDSTTDMISSIAFYAYRKDLTDQVEAHKSDYFSDDDADENPSRATEQQVRQLEQEASAHGDLVQSHICRVALGTEDPVTTADAFEDRYGGGGFSSTERRDIMNVRSQKQAWKLCDRAILQGRG